VGEGYRVMGGVVAVGRIWLWAYLCGMEWLFIIYGLVIASIVAAFVVPNSKIEYRSRNKK